MQMELLVLFYILHHSWFAPGRLSAAHTPPLLSHHVEYSLSIMTGSLPVMSYSKIHSVTNHRRMGRMFQLCWFGGYMVHFLEK